MGCFTCSLFRAMWKRIKVKKCTSISLMNWWIDFPMFNYFQLINSCKVAWSHLSKNWQVGTEELLHLFSLVPSGSSLFSLEYGVTKTIADPTGLHRPKHGVTSTLAESDPTQCAEHSRQGPNKEETLLLAAEKSDCFILIASQLTQQRQEFSESSLPQDLDNTGWFWKLWSISTSPGFLLPL